MLLEATATLAWALAP